VSINLSPLTQLSFSDFLLTMMRLKGFPMTLNGRQLLEALSKDLILGTVPSGLFLVDDKRHIVYWNSEAERITEYSAAEIVGHHCSILEGIECGRGCGLYDDGSPEKPIIGSGCHIRTKAGRKITISKNIDFLRLNGEVVGGIETFIDITSQKEMEKELRHHNEQLEKTVKSRTVELQEERAQLRSILDSMTDMAYIVAADLRIVFFNKAMEKVFGSKQGDKCYEVIHKKKSPCVNCPWEKILTGVIIEERNLDKYNRVYEVIHSPVHGPQGEIQKLAVCRDITERKKAAKKILAVNKQLEAYAHTVSHDLRSPLTGVTGYTEILREKYGVALKGDGVEMLDMIETQAKRMLSIIEDILAFSTADHIEPTNTPVNMNEIVKHVLLDNRFETEEKNVLIITDSLPELKIPETLMYEMVSNLLLNAVRYGCERGGKIEIYGGSDGDNKSISVIDHGPGIPEQERESVFDVFVRGSNAGSNQGTGVGLATVRKIVERFNGKISLMETSGGGCTFKMSFSAD
jgi:PAS domain S-box-containing protein